MQDKNLTDGGTAGTAGAAPGSADEIRRRLQALSSPAGMLDEIVLRAPVGLQLCDRSGRCVLVNPAHTQMFGAVPPPDYNILEDTVLAQRGVIDLLHRAFGGERITIPPIWYDARELENVRVDQARRLAVGAELVPMRAAGDEVTHVLFVFHDVTELHLAREAAEEAARRAQQAAERSAFVAEAGRVFSASLDYERTLQEIARLATPRFADFCIVDVVDPRGHLRRLAASHADAALQPVLDELSRDYSPGPNSPQPAMVVLRSGAPELLEEVDSEVVARHTRDERHFRLMRRLDVRSHLAVPMKLGEATLGVISFGYSGSRRYRPDDVPLAEALAERAAAAIEHARLFEEAQRAQQQADVANRAKDEFLAVLGHELRNPMAPMVNAIEILRLRHGPARELEILQRQVSHMRRLVDDLLDVSRITRGQLRLQLARVDAGEVLRHCADVVQPLAAEKSQQLQVRCDPGEPLPVQADSARLVQAVSNLLLNAVRFTPEGGRIVAGGQRLGADVLLTVEDDGIGIAPALLDTIFEPFVQAEHARGADRGGLGLGLAIVRSIVQAHGGQVTARSGGPGQGSTFSLRLPLHG